MCNVGQFGRGKLSKLTPPPPLLFGGQVEIWKCVIAWVLYSECRGGYRGGGGGARGAVAPKPEIT